MARTFLKAHNAGHQPRRLWASAGWTGYAHNSWEIPVDIKRAMEYSQNINTGWRPDKIGNPIMAIEKDPDLSFCLRAVFVADFGKAPQYLSFFVNPRHHFLCRGRIVGRDVVIVYREAIDAPLQSILFLP